MGQGVPGDPAIRPGTLSSYSIYTGHTVIVSKENTWLPGHNTCAVLIGWHHTFFTRDKGRYRPDNFRPARADNMVITEKKPAF